MNMDFLVGALVGGFVGITAIGCWSFYQLRIANHTIANLQQVIIGLKTKLGSQASWL